MCQRLQVNIGGFAAPQAGYLAIDTAPVAGIVGIQVDANGQAACAARNNRIDVIQSKPVPAVVSGS